MICCLFPFREATQAPAVDNEYVEPSVIVIVEQRNATPRRRQKKILTFMSRDYGLEAQALIAFNIRYVGKLLCFITGPRSSGRVKSGSCTHPMLNHVH